MKNLLAVLFISVSFSAFAQRNILGICTRDSLMKEPFKSWYQKNYDDYSPDEKVITLLKKNGLKDLTFEVFFGTWCGDSRREVPRFLKIADAVGITASQIKMIAVSTGEQYKQSPGGETIGRSIYRVGTFIISRKGIEVNRITEHPVRTLELDLLDIISGNSYQSNYRSFPIVDAWLKDGLLTNPNISPRGLARQLKPILFSPGELNAYGYVLIAQNHVKEAIAIFRINAAVFYDNPDMYSSLAEGLSKDQKHKEALENIEYAFTLNDEDYRIKDLLKSYYQIRKASEEGDH